MLGHNISCAVQVMDHKGRGWSDLWRDEEASETELFAALAEVKAAADANPLPPLTALEVRRLGASLNPRKAMGGDVLEAYDLRRLPDCALEELANMITSWESLGALPWQVLCNLVSLLPKPNGDER